LQPAVVFDEAHFSEFIHEEIDPRARCPDHFRQRLLRSFGKYLVGFILLAIVGEQQKGTCQSFLAGVENLVDQVFLDPYVAFQHIGDEAIGKRTFRMEHSEHFLVLDLRLRARVWLLPWNGPEPFWKWRV